MQGASSGALCIYKNRELGNLFEQVFEVIVFDIGLFRFIVDGQQVDGVMNDLKVSDDAGAAGLSFAFGGHRQA